MKIIYLFCLFFSFVFADMQKHDSSVVVNFNFAKADYSEIIKKKHFLYNDISFDREIKDKNKLAECQEENISGLKIKKCLNFQNLNTEYQNYVKNEDYERYPRGLKIKERIVLKNVVFELKQTDLNSLEKLKVHFFNDKNKILILNSVQDKKLDNISYLYNFYIRNKLEKDFKTTILFKKYKDTLDLKLFENNSNISINSVYINYIGDDLRPVFNSEFPITYLKSDDKYTFLNTYHTYDVVYDLFIEKKNNKYNFKLIIKNNFFMSEIRNRYFFILDHEEKVLKQNQDFNSLNQEVLNSLFK